MIIVLDVAYVVRCTPLDFVAYVLRYVVPNSNKLYIMALIVYVHKYVCRIRSTKRCVIFKRIAMHFYCNGIEIEMWKKYFLGKY